MKMNQNERPLKMRILKTVTVVSILTLSLVATTANATEKNYGYPDITYRVEKTDQISNVENGVFIPSKPNGAGVVVLGPCPGLQKFNKDDTKELAQLFLDNGYTVAVPNYNTAPRPDRRPWNCGKDKNLSDMRLVKDVYDGTAALASNGVNKELIFTVGQSLGAQIGADAIDKHNVDLAIKKGWGPVPRAVIGLYGGCAYPSKTYLDDNIVRPVLWISGEKDTFAHQSYGCSRWVVSDIIKKQPESKFIVYSESTHCFDCKQLDGFNNPREGQTYRYNNNSTKLSRTEILKYMESFK